MKSLALRVTSPNIELAWQVANDVPDHFFGDPSRLRQVLVNLVGNSIKFTNAGEIIVRVSSSGLSETMNELQFSVRDTGIGIPTDRLHAVFDAFQQADSSTTRRYGGTGLGLAICSRLVELMGGEIDVESEVEKGTTFSFTCQLETSSAKQGPRLDASALQDQLVLVVDDNETNRTIFQEMLGKWGMEVVLATGVDEALKKVDRLLAESRSIPLVLTDLHMPDRDGFDLCRKLRETRGCESTQIVMLSSGVREADTEMARRLGLVRVLLKPAKQSELLDAINFALNKTKIESAPAQVNKSSETERVQPIRILLAEDGVANQKLAVALLERWGHTVTIANNGVEAVDAMRDGEFDLVLMDVQMPELDGLEATRQIRALENESGIHTPIVAMTAHAMPGDREKCIELGMDGYLSKPIRREEVFRTLAAITASQDGDLDTVTNDANRDSEINANGYTGIDWAAAMDVAGGDEGILNDIVETSIEEIDNLRTRMDEALNTDDADLLCRTAHSIQGTLRILKNQDAADLVVEIQDLRKEVNVSSLNAQVRKLDELLNQMLSELKQRRA